MRTLKGLVAVLGLLIVTLMILIIYGMLQKSQNPDFSFFSTPPQLPANAPTAPTDSIVPNAAGVGFATSRLRLSPQARVLSTAIGDGHLVVGVDRNGDASADMLVVIDLKTGRETGRIEVGP